MDSNMAILWQSYKQKNNIYFRDRLISSYTPFLKKIVSGVYSKLPNSVDIMDIESYAYVGLMDAIKKYDMDRSIKFETYATYRIKGAILDGLRKHDWLSRTMRSKYKKTDNNIWQKDIEKEKNKKDHQDSDNNDEDKFMMFSIDDPNFYEKKQNECADYVESIYDLYAASTAEFTDRLEYKLIIKDAIKKLTPKQRKIIFLYYFKGKTFKEIGSLMNITESRVSQINRGILVFLRKEI